MQLQAFSLISGKATTVSNQLLYACVLSFCPFFPHLCVAALAAQHEYIFETQDQNDRMVEQ